MIKWITPSRKEGDPIFRRVPLKDRMLARFYDTAIFFLMYGVLAWLLSIVVLIVSPSLEPYGQGFALLASYGWFMVRDGLRGRTYFGKKEREIIVVSIGSMGECTIARSFARNLISDISAIAIFIQFAGKVPIVLIYIIVLAFDIWRIAKAPGGRRIGDIIANTQVVYMDDWVDFQQTIRHRQITNANPSVAADPERS